MYIRTCILYCTLCYGFKRTHDVTACKLIYSNDTTPSRVAVHTSRDAYQKCYADVAAALQGDDRGWSVESLFEMYELRGKFSTANQMFFFSRRCLLGKRCPKTKTREI